MGILRTLFAIAVVFSHTIGLFTLGSRGDVSLMIGGKNAVQLFYMISGFLISYILVERKSYAKLSDFYINRYLRIYPIYLLIALSSLVVFSLAALMGKDVSLFKVYHEAPVSSVILLVIANATLFFQDWVMFLGVRENAMVFTADFSNSDVLLYTGLLVSPAWTLGVELTFYLVAPFLLKNIKIIFLMLLISLGLRGYLISIDVGNSDPWSYRFFPTELALFLLGSIAHQLLLPTYKKLFSMRNLDVMANLATFALVIVTLFYWLVPLTENIKTLCLLVTFFMLMPLTFIFQSTWDWDKKIGDLSYPIYVAHLLVANIATFALAKLGFGEKYIIGIATVIISVAVALVLNAIVGAPVELLRRRFRVPLK